MRDKILSGVLDRGWAVAAIVVAALGWGVTTATAADCGDGVATCQCGDTVVANTTLTADVGGCPKAGLRVMATSVVLDCNFHTLTGVKNGTKDNGEVGIHLDPGTDAEVRNCRVTGFRQGIRIGSGNNNRIINNEV